MSRPGLIPIITALRTVIAVIAIIIAHSDRRGFPSVPKNLSGIRWTHSTVADFCTTRKPSTPVYSIPFLYSAVYVVWTLAFCPMSTPRFSFSDHEAHKSYTDTKRRRFAPNAFSREEKRAIGTKGTLCVEKAHIVLQCPIECGRNWTEKCHFKSGRSMWIRLRISVPAYLSEIL